MTSLSTLCLLVAVVFSALDWVAVARGSKMVEYVAKPAATAAFLVTAATLDAAHGAPWGWRVAALVFCFLGDVFLMLPRDAFVPGLASFAVAQVLLTVSFVLQEPTLPGLVAGLVVAVPVIYVLARRFIGGLSASGHRDLVVPVAVYMTVITAMVVSAVAGGTPSGIAGAVMFMASDSLIAETRFVKPRGWHGVAIMVTYHLALAGLVLGLL